MPAPVFDPAAIGDRRGAARRRVSHNSTLRELQDRIARDVVVSDLSCNGFGVVMPLDLKTGTVVSVGLPGVGTKFATVMRRDGDRYGCQFYPPITPTEVASSFAGTDVVHALLCAAAVPFADPVVERWHPATRLALITIGSTAAWAALKYFIDWAAAIS